MSRSNGSMVGSGGARWVKILSYQYGGDRVKVLEGSEGDASIRKCSNGRAR